MRLPVRVQLLQAESIEQYCRGFVQESSRGAEHIGQDPPQGRRMQLEFGLKVEIVAEAFLVLLRSNPEVNNAGMQPAHVRYHL